MSVGSENLPQFALVGGKGTGKSSLLESLVGKDFLPRGATRAPLVLNLRKSDCQEQGIFLHRPGEKIHDFSRIREEIANRTVILAGLVRLSLDCQPDNFVEQTKSTIMEYISKEETIILAVTAEGLVMSQALEQAMMVDPEGARTIGVITKLDRAQDIAMAELDNKVVPLKWGHVGVVLRSEAVKCWKY
ncbi:Dynamin-A [Folsomia candida]|uniref:Dynamin-A n=1 Tax=Folsomia candida TaxID=158441 RepID=A0A226D298_FOLCA|nr:Dynamin-A [Folsomia candida]